MSDTTTFPEESAQQRGAPIRRDAVLALAVVWCPESPDRLGEVLVMSGVDPASARVFGRGPLRDDDPHARLLLARHRPGRITMGPLGLPRISRVQLVLRPGSDRSLLVENVGRCPMIHEEREVTSVELRPGSVLRLGSQIMFLCVSRPPWLPGDAEPFGAEPFGEPDRCGIVGESAAIWQLRQSIAFVASADKHVLVLGASGTGKELVARAIHALSPRADGPFLARSAATFPEPLIDAELFGNARNYPNHGMAERRGLVGEAHGGTLFLDEFGELPPTSQGHLLRVLDHGEYHRLGEAGPRRSSARFVAATNRDPSSIKHDLAARFPLRIQLPDLNARREDIPLVLRHLMRRMEQGVPVASGRLGSRAQPAARLDARFVEAALRHDYTTHVRELEGFLWSALAHSDGAIPAPQHCAMQVAISLDEELCDRSAGLPGPEQIRACLDRHNGVIERAWRQLGLKNRHVLARLITRYGIEVRRRPAARRRQSDA